MEVKRKLDFLRAGMNSFIFGNVVALMGLTISGVAEGIAKAPENVVVGFASVALGIIVACVGATVAGGAELYEKFVGPLLNKASQKSGSGRT